MMYKEENWEFAWQQLDPKEAFQIQHKLPSHSGPPSPCSTQDGWQSCVIASSVPGWHSCIVVFGLHQSWRDCVVISRNPSDLFSIPKNQWPYKKIWDFKSLFQWKSHWSHSIGFETTGQGQRHLRFNYWVSFTGPKGVGVGRMQRERQ